MNNETLEKGAKIKDTLYYASRDIKAVNELKNVAGNLLWLKYQDGAKDINVNIPMQIKDKILNILSDYFEKEKQDLEQQFEEL